MAWIKIEHHTPDKPELWAVADTLGVDVDLVLGKLIRLLSWADQNVSAERPQCVLSLRALSAKFGLEGFAEALAKVGWLREVDGQTEFVNYDRHNGNSAKRRALDAERNRAKRVRKTSAARPQNVRIKSGPEKRREEKSMKTQNATHSSSSAPTRRNAAVEAEVQPHEWGKGAIRLDTKAWAWIGITEDDKRVWSTAYPAVDVDRQLAAMAAWCKDNPEKGRKGNYGRFINGWLSREQDKGGDHGTTRTNQRGNAPANAQPGYGARYADQHTGPTDRLSNVVERIG